MKYDKHKFIEEIRIRGTECIYAGKESDSTMHFNYYYKIKGTSTIFLFKGNELCLLGSTGLLHLVFRGNDGADVKDFINNNPSERVHDFSTELYGIYYAELLKKVKESTESTMMYCVAGSNKIFGGCTIDSIQYSISSLSLEECRNLQKIVYDTNNK